MNNKTKLGALFLSMACLAQGMDAYADDISILSWQVTTNDETAVVKLDRNTVHGGYAALYASTEHNADDHNKLTTKIYQKASGLEPSTAYRFTYWCKAEHVENYTIVRDIFYSVDAKADESGSYDWTEKHIDFTTTSKGTTAAFQFTLAYGDGEKAEIWIDDVSLQKLEDGEPVGQNLILNGDFEEGIDLIPPNDVSNAAVEAGDGSLTVSWRDPNEYDLRRINVYLDGEPVGSVPGGEQSYTIEGLENGREYEIMLEAEDTSENRSDGVVVYGTPKLIRGIPEVTADDENNVIVGIDEDMEYSVDGGAWAAYADQPDPELEGSHLVKVRYMESPSSSASAPKYLIFYKAAKAPDGGLSFTASMKVDEATVSGSAPAGSRVRIAASYQSDPNTIAFIKEVDADENGSFTQRFYMPYTAPVGYYTVKCKADNTADAEPAQLVYTDKETLDRLISQLRSSSEAEILDILAAQKDPLVSLGVRMDDYEKLTGVNQSAVAKAIYNSSSAVSQSNLDEIINTQIAFGLISQSQNTGETLEALLTYQPWLKLSMSDVGFDSVTDSGQITWICEKISGKTFTSLDELQKYYQKQCAFYVLNNESYVNLGTVMERYQSELGITNDSVYGKYTQLSAAQKEAVNRKVKLASSSYDDTSALMNAVNQAMSSTNTSTGSGGSGGGGGGGGGGSVNSGTGVIGNSVSLGSSVIGGSGSAAGNLPAVGENKLFNDLDSVPWAEKEINALAQLGVLTGMEDGVFAPDALVTREQLAVMTVKAFGLSAAETEEPLFTDVAEDRWSYPQIKASKQNGLINGYDDGSFLPEKNITREDMVLILYRALSQLSGSFEKVREPIDFSDWAEVSDYARDGVREMYCMGLVNGVGDAEFAPKGTATRAMAAKILYDIVERMGH